MIPCACFASAFLSTEPCLWTTIKYFNDKNISVSCYILGLDQKTWWEWCVSENDSLEMADTHTENLGSMSGVCLDGGYLLCDVETQHMYYVQWKVEGFVSHKELSIGASVRDQFCCKRLEKLQLISVYCINICILTRWMLCHFSEPDESKTAIPMGLRYQGPSHDCTHIRQ